MPRPSSTRLLTADEMSYEEHEESMRWYEEYEAERRRRKRAEQSLRQAEDSNRRLRAERDYLSKSNADYNGEYEAMVRGDRNDPVPTCEHCGHGYYDDREYYTNEWYDARLDPSRYAECVSYEYPESSYLYADYSPSRRRSGRSRHHREQEPLEYTRRHGMRSETDLPTIHEDATSTDESSSSRVSAFVPPNDAENDIFVIVDREKEPLSHRASRH